ncbi:hypothetical protein ACFFGV_05200 [Pontibacillus salicampi]|uniref:Uncharacterized protein n=1 Tax=Pontibacillus salicampi TaxID=1449801 RepID=A0ABV6LL17_9BACI
MDRFEVLMVACILAGFALIRVPLEGTFLESVEPVTTVIGIVAILLFSLFLLYKGVRAMLGK